VVRNVLLVAVLVLAVVGVVWAGRTGSEPEPDAEPGTEPEPDAEIAMPLPAAALA
jgi:hypothetical protein